MRKRITQTLVELLSVGLSAGTGFVVTCSIALCISAFRNGVPDTILITLPQLVLCLALDVLIWRIMLRQYETPEQYKQLHNRVLSVPKPVYIAIALLEMVFLALAVHATVIMNAVPYERMEQVVSAVGFDESVVSVCTVLRGLPQSIVYWLVESMYTVQAVDMNDPNSVALAEQVYSSIFKVSCIQTLVMLVFWGLFAFCRYPGKAFNTYMFLKKSVATTNVNIPAEH